MRHEKNQKKVGLAAPELDNQSGHARQRFGKEIFARADEKDFTTGRK